MNSLVEDVLLINQSNCIIYIALSFLDKLCFLYIFNILIYLMHLYLGDAHWTRILTVKVRDHLRTAVPLATSFWSLLRAIHWSFRRASDRTSNWAVVVACFGRDEPSATLTTFWHDAWCFAHSDDAWAFITLAYKVSILDVDNRWIKQVAWVYSITSIFWSIPASV